MNNKLLSTVRFYFAQSVFMGNCHYKAYGRLESSRKRFSNISIGITVITVIVLCLQVIGFKEENLKFCLNIASFLGLAATAASIFFQFLTKEDVSLIMWQHKLAAENYQSLRDEYMGLIEAVLSGALTDEALRFKRDELQKRYSALGLYSPTTSYDDYQQTQKGLGLSGNSDEEFTWSNEEIDRFLPKQLRSQSLSD